jgi:hypothetical protein
MNISQKKVCLVPQKYKGVKISYEGYPTEFVGSTQYHKINRNKKFLKKKYVCTLKVEMSYPTYGTSKVKKRQKFAWELLEGICGLDSQS